jgi:signal transduction histidine kinase/ligand-binding sensor domain-containing protein
MSPGPRRVRGSQLNVDIRRVSVLLSLLSLCVAAMAAGQPQRPRPPIAQYALAAWATEKMLPGDVLAIAQDLEGYLWLGTPNGLVRFDGFRFQPWTNGGELPAAQVFALLSSSKSGLWVGFAGGHGVARVYKGRTIRYLPKDGAPQGVNGLIEDRHGAIWVTSGHGLFRFADDRWTKLTEKDGYDGEQSFSAYEDHAGRVWIGAARGLYRYENSRVTLIDRSATAIESLTEDEAGNIWVTDRNLLVRRLNDNTSLRRDPVIRLPLSGWRVMRDERGSLLVASSSGGLFRIAEPTAPAPVLEPLPYEQRLRGSPRALYQDHDETVWVGMRGGLLRLSESTVQAASPLDGLNHDGVRTTALGADGSVWVATTHALNRFAPGGTHESYPVSQGRVIYVDRTGELWLATDDFVGRFVNGHVVKEPIPDVEASRIHALTKTTDRLWMCTAFRGVLSWHDGIITSHRQPDETARQCFSILTDSHDRVWAGFTSGGIVVHERGTVRAFTERDGLAPGSVMQIMEARDGSVWFATSGGVSRYQHARFTSITTANAPVSAVVPVLVEDDEGYIWVGVQSGAAMMRFHPREMDKVATDVDHRLAYTLFDESDGLQPGTRMWTNGVGGVRDLDGRLWLVNGAGMTIVDPRRLQQVRRPSAPRVDIVTVDGQRIEPIGDVTLRNGATLQIDYAALSLAAASKVRFRHQLTGVDPDWVYDEDERQTKYTNLQAGAYQFLVSTTYDGQWTEPALWAFDVAPPFYLRRSFLLIAAVVVLASVALGTWLRERAMKSRYALVVAERTRMSREIHDTLLQSLASLGPELEALAVSLPSGDRTVVEELRRLRRQVGRSVREARDSILELRSNSMSPTRLGDSLNGLADATASRHGVRPNVIVTGRRSEHAAYEMEAQLFQIAREAVGNAVRHGKPTNIDIVLNYEADQVSLTIKDNGCGFITSEQATWRREGEHFGLVTMHERAEKIGGRLYVESNPGTGTTLLAVAPVTGA